MWQRLQRAFLFTRLVAYAFKAYFSILRRSVDAKAVAFLSRNAPDTPRTKNIVVVGAAFAGYHAANLITKSLPRGSPYRVVVIEPNTHYNFTWVLPRFCVIEGHEHKAFIPYGGYFAGVPKGAIQWIRDRAVSVGKTSVQLRDGKQEIPYDFLVIATGSTVSYGLPSRVGSEDKEEGVKLLQGIQQRVRNATKIVVAGGGAAGVEVATDAKGAYPDKNVILVHSRGSVMHRFGPGLQTGAMEAIEKLGIKVILNEKVITPDASGGFVTLSSGENIECDCYLNCTGQRPAGDILTDLAPGSISASGHIKVKPTLQIGDDTLPNVFICGDVADTSAHMSNPNARSAMRQAEVVADNVILATRGKQPRHKYTPQWGDGLIKLTLGLDRSILEFWDGKGELLFPSEEKDLALMCDGAWKVMGATPFEDPGEFKAE